MINKGLQKCGSFLVSYYLVFAWILLTPCCKVAESFMLAGFLDMQKRYPFDDILKISSLSGLGVVAGRLHFFNLYHTLHIKKKNGGKKV